MNILSTLGFAAPLTNGTILAAAQSGTPQPIVAADGTLTGLPNPQQDTLFLVNARVFGATDRPDFVMFAPQLTVRNVEGLVTAQGGYITRSGEVVPF